MVTTFFEPPFERFLASIKDGLLRTKIKKQITKIVLKPDVGKPMCYARKGTREVYVPPFRISYLWSQEEQKVIFLDVYHKDEQ